jgi:feruloyl-CoA synthase
MVRETIRCIEDEPPVLVDWLPWNHTFGGNHNFGITLFNGGSMYIDEGRPMPGAIDATARNLQEIAPTIYYNVPKGFEALLPHLRGNAVLRKTFFSRLQASFFAGAGLAAHVWQALDEIAIAETGYRMPMLTGLGATETAPYSLSVTPQTSRSGHVGLPVPGNHIKLVPNSGKLEVRVKGDNVTPGYWRQPELTEAAFDEEGYYKFGDALKPVDPADLSKGFDFDGRIAEDFKLASATWVSVGPLRVALIGALAPFARDVVIAAPDRDHLTAIVIPDLDAIHEAFSETRGMAYAAKMAHQPLRARLAQGLAAHAVNATSNSTRIERIVVLDEPPSIDVGEITDKGSINQRAVLAHRAKLVQSLFSSEPPAASIAAPQRT